MRAQRAASATQGRPGAFAARVLRHDEHGELGERVVLEEQTGVDVDDAGELAVRAFGDEEAVLDVLEAQRRSRTCASVDG